MAKILIVGGGLVGLSLAQALKARGIDFEIFERDESLDARKAGWGITLHWGLPIFKSLVPERIFNRLSEAAVNPAAQLNGEKGAFTVYNLQTGATKFHAPGADMRRLKRSGLRQLLADGIDIQWSKQLESITADEGDGITAVFKDGSMSRGDCLVGCDGARSVVRRLLVGSDEETNMHPLPCRLLGVSAVFPASTVQSIRDLDPYFLLGGDESQDVFFYFSFLDSPSSNQRHEKDSYTCQIMISWPLRPPELPEIPASPSAQLRFIKRLAKDWAHPFSTLLAAIPDDTIPIVVRLEDWSPLTRGRAVETALPADHRPWNNFGGRATLAGDAAHAMTMYRGEAFNHGLRDVECLLECITPLFQSESTPNVAGLQDAIGRYDVQLAIRGHNAVLASRQACLDAHDQKKINADSPLVARGVKHSAVR